MVVVGFVKFLGDVELDRERAVGVLSPRTGAGCGVAGYRICELGLGCFAIHSSRSYLQIPGRTQLLPFISRRGLCLIVTCSVEIMTILQTIWANM